jgi:hypothetical protein
MIFPAPGRKCLICDAWGSWNERTELLYRSEGGAELSDFKRGPSGAREFEPEVKAMLEREEQDFS